MATRCTPVSEDWLVFLVNEFGTEPRRVAGELGSAYPAVDDVPGCPAEARSCSTARLSQVADQLHPVFTAASEEERSAKVNALLRSTMVAPQSEPDAPGGIGWLVPGTPAQRLPVVAALTLLELMRDGRRIGHCAAEDCMDVYVGQASGRPRTFCSDGCQSRHKVRTFRRRHRTE